MVKRPLRPCNKVGCKNITDKGYCEDHEHIPQEQNRERHKFYNNYVRDKETQKFYDSREWRRLREQFIKTNGLCKHCLDNNKITHADVVDHIIPIRVDWSLRLTINNLQSLCNGCHAIKTAEDKRKYGDRL